MYICPLEGWTKLGHARAFVMKRRAERDVLMKSYSTVIFDLDGTLLNTLEDLTNATNQALRECGYPEHTMEDVKGFVGNGIGMLIRRALPPECDADPEAYEMALQAFKRYYFLHNNDTTAPYPGIPELIDALQEKGLKLAVVSNKNDPNVKALCRYYFPTIPLAVGEREGIRRKPEPDTVLHVMKEFGSAKCHTLYVGDSDVDVQTARNAGVDCAAVLWGFRSEEHLKNAGAEHLFHSPEELCGWILSHQAK